MVKNGKKRTSMPAHKSLRREVEGTNCPADLRCLVRVIAKTHFPKGRKKLMAALRGTHARVAGLTRSDIDTAFLKQMDDQREADAEKSAKAKDEADRLAAERSAGDDNPETEAAGPRRVLELPGNLRMLMARKSLLPIRHLIPVRSSKTISSPPKMTTASPRKEGTPARASSLLQPKLDCASFLAKSPRYTAGFFICYNRAENRV